MTARVKRMTLREALQSHPDPAKRSESLDRLHHVDGAGGLESTGWWKEWGEESLVSAE
jgi:hypothetical protein